MCYSLSTFHPSWTLCTHPHPQIFTVWTRTDCGQRSIWDNIDCQCNVLEEEEGRTKKKEKVFTWCRKEYTFVLNCYSWKCNKANDKETGRHCGKVAYPGTLGRFLTVQVLCHLGHKVKKSLAYHISASHIRFKRIELNQGRLQTCSNLGDITFTCIHQKKFLHQAPIFSKGYTHTYTHSSIRRREQGVLRRSTRSRKHMLLQSRCVTAGAENGAGHHLGSLLHGVLYVYVLTH